jgi:hypothetical protein
MRLVYTIMPEDLVDKYRGIFLCRLALYIVFWVLARRLWVYCLSCSVCYGYIVSIICVRNVVNDSVV